MEMPPIIKHIEMYGHTSAMTISEAYTKAVTMAHLKMIVHNLVDNNDTHPTMAYQDTLLHILIHDL